MKLWAYHFREGNNLEKAVIYSHRAGVKAASRFAYREAVLYFEQALGALERLPEGRQKLEQAIAIRMTSDLRLSPLEVIWRRRWKKTTSRRKSCAGDWVRPLNFFRFYGRYHESVTGGVNCPQPGGWQSNCFLSRGANKTPFVYQKPITRYGRSRWT
jgi:hypothetical protein